MLSMNKKTLLPTLLAVLLMTFASGAQAEVTGIIFGHLHYTDTRAAENPSDFPESIYVNVTDDDEVVARPIRQVLLRVQAVPESGPGGTEVLPVTYVRTDDSGGFFVDWVDPRVNSAFSRRVRIEIIWGRPDMDDSFNVQIHEGPHPEMIFTVSSLYGGEMRSVIELDAAVGTSAITFLDRTIDAGNLSAAYATMLEVFENVLGGVDTNVSPILADRMKGISLALNAPGLAFTPRADTIIIGPEDSLNSPFTIAHEMGHLIVWNSFGLSGPGVQTPLDLQDYCSGDLEELAKLLPTCRGEILDFFFAPSLCPCFHSLHSLEREKASWGEGIANALGAAWFQPLTTNERSVRIPIFDSRDGEFFDIERSETCAPGPQPWGERRESCQAMAIWDLLDTDPLPIDLGADAGPVEEFLDDPVNYFTVADLVEVLDSYEDCLFDRCIFELSDDGLNHWDFAFHFAQHAKAQGAHAGHLEQVYDDNSLLDGTR